MVKNWANRTTQLSKEDWVEKYVRPNVLDDLKEHSQVHGFDPEKELEEIINLSYQDYINNLSKD